MFCVSVYVCTWGLEVNASHLHRVGWVVRRDFGVVQQTFRPWLRLFPFAALENEKKGRKTK